MYCTKSFDTTNQTTTAYTHVVKKHAKQQIKKENERFPHRLQETKGPMDRFLNQQSSSTKFSSKSLSDSIVKLVVVHDLPFTAVEWPEFVDLINLCRPDTSVYKRSTLKTRIEEMYVFMKNSLIQKLQAIEGKFSLTCDCWTAKNQIPFLAVTIHYIDHDWKLCNSLLTFTALEGQHSEERLAKALFDALVDFQICNKLLAITSDNASNNNTMMVHLQTLLGQESLF
jgi:hypothetical protein